MFDALFAVYVVATSILTVGIVGALLFDFWATFWPVTDGKVVSFSCRASGGTPRMTTEIYCLGITYEYRYNGVAYFGRGFSSVKDLLTTDVGMVPIYKERYARGQDVKVHVCPVFPKLSFVGPYLHKNPFTYIYLLIAVIFLAAGILAYT